MNVISRKSGAPIVAAFKKSKISHELQNAFLQFLSDYPDCLNQALYLLESKNSSIEEILYELYDVPVKEQASWTKDHSKNSAGVVLDVPFPISEAFVEITPQPLFKAWKQEHGFDSNPLEVGDAHTFIRLERYFDLSREVKYKWTFNRTRYGKGGWGSERLIKSIVRSLLDNNSHVGWVVRSFLEENKRVWNLQGDEKIGDDIPNPLVLNSFDSHILVALMLGHPYFYLGSGEQPIKNAFHELQFGLYHFFEDNNHFLVGFFCYEVSGERRCILAEELLSNPVLLTGYPAALIYENKYYRIAKSPASFKMLQDSLNGIFVPEDEWNDFFHYWQTYYPDLALQDIPPENNYSPSLISKSLRYWGNWVTIPENSWLKEQQVTKPVIKLFTESKHYQSNKISFVIENFDKEQLVVEHPDKNPYHHRLFSMIRDALTENVGDNGKALFTFERQEASHFLQLLENYDHCFNHEGQPLFSREPLHFSITVHKNNQPQNLQGLQQQNQFYLQGEVSGQEENGLAINLTAVNQVRAIGLVPAYMLYKNQIYRIDHMQSARIINDSLAGVLVEEQEIGDFYAVALPFLKQREILLRDPHGLLRVSALYNYKIRGHMTIWEVEGILMGRLICSMLTDIGEFEYPVGCVFDEFTQKLDERRYQIPRNKPLENALFEEIYRHGWIDEGDGEYSMNEVSTENFVLGILRHHQDSDLIWYYGKKKLKKWKVRTAEPHFSTSIQSGIDWFDVNVKIEVEGRQISLESIINLWKIGQSSLKMPDDDGVVVIDKKWLSKFAPLLDRLVDSNASRYQQKIDQQIAKDLNDLQNGTAIKVSGVNVGLLCELETVSKHAKVDQEWRNIAQKFRQQGFERVTIPNTVNACLRDYQKDGVSWLCFLRKAGFSGILADDMGLGKTLQALSFLAVDRAGKQNLKPVLVVAPTSVVYNWQEEIDKFVPSFKTLVSHGPKRKKSFTDLLNYDVVVTSYNLVQRDIEIFSSYEYSIIILDEAQMIKNARSKNAQAVLGLNSEFRLSLTGTPVENSILELWSQFNFLMPGFLGCAKDFKKIAYQSRILDRGKNRGDLNVIRRQTKPFILRRMKQNVATELPDKIEQTLYCEMEGAQRDLYDGVLEVIRKDIKQKIRTNTLNQNKIAVFDAILRLRQICCDPRLSRLTGDNPPESAKLNLFLETIVEIVEEGHRVLVFSQFVKMLDLMHDPLQKNNIAFLQLDGSVSKRQELVNKFQTYDDFPVFLVSLKAGGVGINLTAADYVIHYDPWWNPAVENQATDRAYRIGQKKHVHVYKLITSNSIEEKIQYLQQKKRKLADSVVCSASNVEDICAPDDLAEIFDL